MSGEEVALYHSRIFPTIKVRIPPYVAPEIRTPWNKKTEDGPIRLWMRKLVFETPFGTSILSDIGGLIAILAKNNKAGRIRHIFYREEQRYYFFQIYLIGENFDFKFGILPDGNSRAGGEDFHNEGWYRTNERYISVFETLDELFQLITHSPSSNLEQLIGGK